MPRVGAESWMAAAAGKGALDRLPAILQRPREARGALARVPVRERLVPVPITWPAVLLGNLLAAAVMGGYLWRRHPRLTIWP